VRLPVNFTVALFRFAWPTTRANSFRWFRNGKNYLLNQLFAPFAFTLDLYPSAVIIQWLNFEIVTRSMETSPDPAREIHLLDQIEIDPNVTQASLATHLGVAVGTVNWHLKRLIAKGYVKIKRAERRKLRYIITPEGIALRARLTVDYVEQSMLLYHRMRERVRGLLAEVKQAGYNQVQIDVDGEKSIADIADICRLTCLEQGIQMLDCDLENHADGNIPRLEIRGMKVTLHMGDDYGNQ
jgi:DNA-binding MarR family transcriptional regulator